MVARGDSNAPVGERLQGDSDGSRSRFRCLQRRAPAGGAAHARFLLKMSHKLSSRCTGGRRNERRRCEEKRRGAIILPENRFGLRARLVRWGRTTFPVTDSRHTGMAEPRVFLLWASAG